MPNDGDAADVVEVNASIAVVGEVFTALSVVREHDAWENGFELDPIKIADISGEQADFR